MLMKTGLQFSTWLQLCAVQNEALLHVHMNPGQMVILEDGEHDFLLKGPQWPRPKLVMAALA